MRENYPACEKRVLAYEGSTYTDGVHPYDPGGPTRWGITIADARMYWKPSATPNDVRLMPVEVAEQIYKTKYWDKVRGDDLPSGLDETVFDYGVNSGIGRSGKVLRRIIGLPDNTSLVTDEVLAAIAKRDVKQIIVAINDERLRFLQSLAIWPTYKNGWTKRVNDVKAFSLALASKTVPAEAPAEAPGKGTVTPPETTKNVIKGGAAAGPVGIIASFSDWISKHPAEAIAIAVVAIGVVVLVLHLINKRHKSAQEAPMPGVVPVPVQVPQ